MVSILLLFNLPPVRATPQPAGGPEGPLKAHSDEHQRWLADSGLETALSQHFIPALQKVPGLTRLEVSRSLGGPQGVKRYDRAIRLCFDDEESMRTALVSPEMRKVVGMAMGHLHLHDISITYFDDRTVDL